MQDKDANIATTDNKLPVESEQAEMVMPLEEKILYLTKETVGIDFQAVIGQVVQYINMSEILAKIKAGTQYVIKIPAKYQVAFDAGDLFMMQNQETNVMWPSLMEIAEDGRHRVVTPLPISEQVIVHGNPIQNIAESYHNLLMQQQMARLTAMVEDTYLLVERIEHGQMDDRIGRLEAGKNGLLLALSMPEGSERIMQINSARQNILVAQAQIGQTLQRRAGEFKELPKAAAGRFARELLHSGYHAGKDKEVNEMQEYFDLYLQATKLIAASYAMCGDLKTAEESFRLGEQFIRSIDFSKVKSISHAHKDLKDMFFSSPVEYIEKEREICLEEAKDYECVALEVSGEILLEVLSDGQTETIPETEAEQ